MAHPYSPFTKVGFTRFRLTMSAILFPKTPLIQTTTSSPTSIRLHKQVSIPALPVPETGNTGLYLCGIAVHYLLSTDDKVLFADFLNCTDYSIASCPGIRTGEGSVGYKDSFITAKRYCFPEGALCLWQPHSKGVNFSKASPFLLFINSEGFLNSV